MQTLFLGQKEALQDALFAGPWALPQKVLLEDDRTLQTVQLAPEPFDDPEIGDQAAKQARTLIAHFAPQIASVVKNEQNLDRSQRYWDILLAPWLCRVCEVLIDRLYRCASLIHTYGDRALSVPLLKTFASFDSKDSALLSLAANGGSFVANAGSFATTSDFVFHGVLNPKWNHWLFSQLLQKQWPSSWLPIYEEDQKDTAEKPIHDANKALESKNADKTKAFFEKMSLLQNVCAKNWCKNCLKEILFSLPFPRVKGFSTMDSLRLSLCLLHHGGSDDTISLADLAEPDANPLPLGWTEAELLPLLVSLLPQSFRHLPKHLEKSCVPTRVVSVAACDDDFLRRRVAAWRECGCKLVFIQHGGEYGYLRNAVAYQMVEYCQHRFITWGWHKHGTFAGHFLPLPHPQLAALQGKYQPDPNSSLIFVGTEMALLPYTLKSTVRATQFFAYRQAKAQFLARIPESIRAKALYRPYFNVPSQLPDAPWLQAKISHLQLCTGPLEPHLLKCRLLVLDHPGTTIAQAFAADIPTVLFWNPAHVFLTAEAEELLEKLRLAGVWHASAESAADHVAKIWDSPLEWWQESKTKQAVKAWAKQHALTPDLISNQDWFSLWQNALRDM